MRVRRGQRLARLQHAIDRRFDREHALAIEQAAQIGAFEQLHRDERHAVEHVDVEHARDVLAAQSETGARFDREAAHCLGVGRELRPQKLERHHVVETDVPGSDDEADATGADQP